MTSRQSLITRDDTFLGVCEGFGQDFGFNPLWLRLAFAVTLLFNPAVVVGTYLGLGLVVAFTHWLYPTVRRQGNTLAIAPATGSRIEIASSSQNHPDVREDFAIAA